MPLPDFEQQNGAIEGIDPGIAKIVRVLRAWGVDTFESCEGGPGHAFPEPTVRFHGWNGAGLIALGIALEQGLPVARLRRVWWVRQGEVTGPDWEMTFMLKKDHQEQSVAPPPAHIPLP